MIDEWLPQALQSPWGPEVTLHNMAILKAIYSEKPRYGGVHPRMIYPNDTFAYFKVLSPLPPLSLYCTKNKKKMHTCIHTCFIYMLTYQDTNIHIYMYTYKHK